MIQIRSGSFNDYLKEFVAGNARSKFSAKPVSSSHIELMNKIEKAANAATALPKLV